MSNISCDFIVMLNTSCDFIVMLNISCDFTVTLNISFNTGGLTAAAVNQTSAVIAWAELQDTIVSLKAVIIHYCYIKIMLIEAKYSKIVANFDL